MERRPTRGANPVTAFDNQAGAARARTIPQGVIRTVEGDVGRSAGVALVHEHVSSDLSARSGPTFLLSDHGLAVAELVAAREEGVILVVDTGNTGHKRDPGFLHRCAVASGVAIVASTGHYRQGFFPPAVTESSADRLAAGMVADLTTGFKGSAIRAGAIAEIGCSGAVPTPDETKVLRAAGMAQAQTGAPLMTHTAEGLGWENQLQVLSGVGVNLGRVVIGHMDCLDDEAAHRAIIDRGAWLGFDRVGLTALQSDQVRCRLLAGLERDGYLGRVLLSMDIATTERYRKAGAPGYAGIITDFIPRLEAVGMSAAAIHQLVYENPWTFLLS